MEAIILAGGHGTRLKSVIDDVPKPMAPVKNLPFLQYLLNNLNKNGISRVILSVGYKWEVIENYFGSKYKNIELIYSIEKTPLGTGGAIKKAIPKIHGKIFYIVNGDTYFDINMSKMPLHKQSLLTIALKNMKDCSRYGIVSHSQGFVTSFEEKSSRESGNINGGVYLASVDLFNNYELNDNFSFETFIESNFKRLNVFSKIYYDYFVDIGIPEDYEKAQLEIQKL